jgi:gamma-D-glutamyl-L-lysine dipeptidyl-peptidase
MKAIVKAMIANLYAEPNQSAELIDEVLYGMAVHILEEPDSEWVLVRTAYQYEGYCQKADLLLDEQQVNTWVNEAAYVVGHNFADVLQEPRIRSAKMTTLVKGSPIHCIQNDEVDKEWATVQLATGETGYTRTMWLHKKINDPLSEKELREGVIQTALSYLKTPYRWGGKSPLGIDCSGLCSMAYLLNGVYIYRDARIEEGFPIKEISFEHIQPGDLLYFPGHIAMYIGDHKYVHSSLGGNEVNINSLDKQHPDYREDLATTITAVGSLFA